MYSAHHMWNERAKVLGESLSSVMEQSFPDVVNKTIHDIHLKEIIRAMPNTCKLVLDVGCGWGRIALDIVNHRGVYVHGVDVSSRFAKLFNKRLQRHGRAVVSDMRNLPFADNSFDLVYCVVSLMYLSTNKDQKEAVSEMFRVLKKGGRFVLIEPNFLGTQIVRLGGLAPFVYRKLLRRPKVETYGVAFRRSEIEAFVRRSGGRILYAKGYPLFTILLLLIVFIGKISPFFARVMISLAIVFDRIVPLTAPSYFVTWVIQKPKENAH